MYSWEIDNLMKAKNYQINVEEFIKINRTSTQVILRNYDYPTDKYYLRTNDNYEWWFKVRR